MEIVNHFVVLIWIVSLYVLGLWLFGDGFLLKRNELHSKSSCDQVPLLNRSNVEITPTTNCWFPSKFVRSIVIVIDALRYDFARFSKSRQTYFTNKFTTFDELLKNGSGCLFKFRADPPTTTLQRLKGLTTGSLPTFIDVSANFASTEIEEDNLIYQLINNGRKIVFMGDDTWENLFPGRFHRSFAYPSFNVKDLHTVDNGIIEHLIPEMNKADWDVIIAHFLGVDHCGHLYGPSHPAMAEKLSQMNRVVRDVVENMKNDTVLWVFGDHGMTRTGDHGGDSDDEISSALFIYSPLFHCKNISYEDVTVVNQVDLVPTFALMMGIPIPFSNLGSVITPLILSVSQQNFSSVENLEANYKELMTTVSALAINSFQVHHYIVFYNQEFKEISPEIVQNYQHKLEMLENLWMKLKINLLNNGKFIDKYHLLKELYQGYTDYLHHVRHECEKMWAKFDIFSMIEGLIVLFCAVINNCLVIFVIRLKPLSSLLKKNAIINFIIISALTFISIINVISLKTAIQIGILGSVISSVIITIPLSLSYFYNQTIWKSLNQIDKISFFITLCSFLTFFSNSFLVYENKITIYFLLTLLMANFLPKSISYCINNLRTNQILHIMWYPSLLLILLINVKIGAIFFKCREEQWPCNSSTFLIPLSSLPPEWQDYRTPRLLLSCSTIGLITFTIWSWLYYNNRLNCYTPATLCAQYSLPIATICICFYWTLGLVPQNVIDQLVLQRQGLLPQTSIGLCFITIFILYFSPLLVAEEHSLSGVGTLFVECSYSLALLLFSILPIIFLIAEDGLSPVIFLISVSAVLFLYLSGSYQSENGNANDVPWHTVVTWNLFMSNGFFITGHQFSFPAIHWQAAFVLTPGNPVNYLLSAIIIILNTFSSHVLFGLAVPLLLTWPQAYLTLSNQKKQCKINLQSFRCLLLQLLMKYILICGIKLLGAASACFLLRRHLMVWKIFAPRLIFESVGFIVTILSIVFGYIFVLLVQRAFHKLVLKLSQSSWDS